MLVAGLLVGEFGFRVCQENWRGKRRKEKHKSERPERKECKLQLELQVIGDSRACNPCSAPEVTSARFDAPALCLVPVPFRYL